tara:strand:+ start:105414 stop:106820 length:1407 start_codon:yes stop_codon:yes gene_type:complete
MVSFEDTLFKSLLYDSNYVRKVLPYLDDSYFDGSRKTLFNIYKNLFDEYNEVPTLEAIGVVLQKSPVGESEFEEIAELLTTCHKNRKDLPNTEFLVKETEEYCRDKKLYDSIYQSISILEDEKSNKNSIPDLLEDALSISFDTSIGMDFFEDAEKRYEAYTAEDARIPFPLNALNRLSNGGHKKKSLSCVLAGTNTGKSALMCYLCGEFLRRGLNVLYISLEMAEEDVQERIEANLLNVSTDELKKLTKEQYMGKIRNLQSKTNGKFVAKEYPTSAGHVGHFRHLIKELKQKKKFEPDFIFVDYINICASYRISAQGSNSYSYIKAIAEELRGLSMEMNTPIMTATQVNRSGMDKSPEMTDTSDSFGLPMSLDFFISLSQNEVHQENGQQLINCIKTRWGNKSKIKPELVNIDWDKMRYSDIDSATSVASKVGNNKPKTSKGSNESSTGSSLRDKKKRKGSSAEFQWE